MLRALIGSHGTIGSTLLDHMTFDCVFNSNNIKRLCNFEFDQVVVAAPSGNRLAVNRGNTSDVQDVQNIVSAIKTARPTHVVLISSVDAVANTNSHYGLNRVMLENSLSQLVPTSIIRLSTLIGPRIKKNVLYDIKHNLFLDSIDGGAKTQWCLLADLSSIITQACAGDVHNIVSEPISHNEILARYRPNLHASVETDKIYYNQQPYYYTREQIFAAMDDYIL